VSIFSGGKTKRVPRLHGPALSQGTQWLHAGVGPMTRSILPQPPRGAFI
jgi:hypothetical protein